MKRNLGLAAAMVTVVMVFMGCQQPHEHSWDDGTVTLEPTCTEKGIKIFKCTDIECGEEYTEDIAAKGHSCGDWTITDDKHWKECGECGKKIEEAVHNFIYKDNGWQKCEICDKENSTPVSLDVLGTYDSTKMTFGVYPNTIKANDVTVDKSVKNTEITGADYYLGSDGAWYAECVENAYSDRSKYSDGSTVSKKDANSVKYFKVEPIEWVYLAKTKCLHAKKVLTANVMWNEDDVTYMISNIRSWLNETFYDSAFTENQKKKIKTTTVDNSVASTIDEDKLVTPVTDYFACADTEDNIFLLSIKEVSTAENGFTPLSKYGEGNSRIRFSTDYALANYCRSGNSSYGSEWWLRSHHPSSDRVDLIQNNGCLSNAWVYDIKSGGVVPALSIYE